jgi:antitoxin MazE
MQTEIKKWGNSAVVRLPAILLAQLKIAVGSPVDLKIEDGRIIVEPSGKKEYKLDELLAGITRENRHESVEWGKAVGREVNG